MTDYRTWIKLGAGFIDDCDVLSSDALRTHITAIARAYRTKELQIPIRAAERITSRDAVAELIDRKFWRSDGEYCEILHHADVILESLEAQRLYRERSRRKQRAYRERQAAVSDHVSGYVTGNATVTQPVTPASATATAVPEGKTTVQVSKTPGTTGERSSEEVSSKVRPLRRGKGHPLTETVKQEIKRLVDGGMPRAEVARTLGIGLTTVYHHAPSSDGSVAFTS